MSIQSRIVTGIILFFLGIAIGFRIDSWRNEAALKAKDDQIIALQQASQKVSSAYEAERQQHAQTILDLQKKVRTAHAANPNTACVLDGDGLLDISDAIDSAR